MSWAVHVCARIKMSGEVAQCLGWAGERWGLWAVAAEVWWW